MKKQREYTWKAFWIRQLKLYLPTVIVCSLFWDLVEYSRMVHEYLSWTFEGYGPPQQRWYRVIATGFIMWAGVITLMDLISVWHYTKNPDEIPKRNEDVLSRSHNEDR